jgi:multiple sugar transport system ATP-binding protein
VGTPLELYGKPKNLFVAGFIGSPAMNFLPCWLIEAKAGLFIGTVDFKIPLPEAITGKVRLHGEKEFICGIRPEDISKKVSDKALSPNGATIKARVNVIETLGKEIYLDLTTGQNYLAALLDSDIEVKPRQDIDLEINMDKIHLFSKETGEAFV